jgi:hypothetical protein
VAKFENEVDAALVVHHFFQRDYVRMWLQKLQNLHFLHYSLAKQLCILMLELLDCDELLRFSV